MADIERAKKALINAHNAGDTESAKAIANYIKSQQNIEFNVPPIDLNAPYESKKVDMSMSKPISVKDLPKQLYGKPWEKYAGVKKAPEQKVEDGQQSLQKPPVKHGSGFFGRVASDWDKRGEQLREISARENTQSPISTATQRASVYASAPVDVLSEAQSSLLSGAAKMFPGYADMLKTVAAGASQLPSFSGRTVGEDVSQELQRSAGKSAARYEQLKQEYPEIMGNVEAAGRFVNVASNVPALGIAGKAVSKTLLKGGDIAVKAGEKQASKIKNKFVQELVLPEQTKKIGTETAKRNIKETGGLLNAKEIIPTPKEQEMADVVSNVLGVSKNKTYAGNISAINEEINFKGNRLKALIAKNEANIPHQMLAAELENTRKGLGSFNHLTGDAAASADNAINEFNRIFSTKPQTASGLLEARKEFDQWVTNQKSKLLDVDPTKAALNDAILEVRRTANNLIADRVPNVEVNNLLHQQHVLIKARNNIAPKAFAEGSNRIQRLWNKAEKAVSLKGALIGTGALGAGGMVAGSSLLPITVTGGLIYYGGKALNSSQAKKVFGKALKLAGHVVGGPEYKKVMKVADDLPDVVPKDVLIPSASSDVYNVTPTRKK